MARLTIKTRLIIALIIILVPSIFGISFLNYTVSRDAVREELRTTALPLTGETAYSEIHGDLMRPIFVSSLMANDTFLKDWALEGEEDVDLIVKYLREIKEKYGFFTAFFVSAQTGHYYYYDGILKDISPKDKHDVWYYSFVESRSEYVLDVDTNEAADNKLTIFMNFRIEDYQDNLLGVTGVGLNMDRVAQLVASYKEKYDREIFMTSPEGAIQVHSNQKFIGTTSLRDMPGLAEQADAILFSGKTASSYAYDAPDGHHLLAVRFIPEFDWFLFVDQNDRAILETARNNFVRTMLLGLSASLIVILICSFAVNHYQTRLEFMARTDELTGAANRRQFEDRFGDARSRFKRNSMPFSIVLMDLDGFKSVNDRFGHIKGDEVLIQIAEIIRSCLRPTDRLARWGGDEFIVLLDGDSKTSVRVAERIRNAVAEAAIPTGKYGTDGTVGIVTVSCGLAEYREGEDIDLLTKRADAALYQAKHQGRNTIVSS